MKIVDVTETTEFSAVLAALEGETGDVVLARDGLPIARLSKIVSVGRTPGQLADSPAWRDFRYDPSLFAALETDAELAAEGWPV